MLLKACRAVAPKRAVEPQDCPGGGDVLRFHEFRAGHRFARGGDVPGHLVERDRKRWHRRGPSPQCADGLKHITIPHIPVKYKIRDSYIFQCDDSKRGECRPAVEALPRQPSFQYLKMGKRPLALATSAAITAMAIQIIMGDQISFRLRPMFPNCRYVESVSCVRVSTGKYLGKG